MFLLPGQPSFGIDFVVDTGFNDYLTLPPQAIRLMNLPLYSSIPARLADNSESLLPIHLANILWDEEVNVGVAINLRSDSDLNLYILDLQD